MKIATIDTETTGLDPNFDLTLELGVVLYDPKVHGSYFDKLDFSKLPKLCLRIIHELGDRKFNDVVENMNERLLTPLRTREYLNYLTTDHSADFKYVSPDSVQSELMKFLYENDFITSDELANNKIKDNKLNILGKNFAMFDRKFLEKLINFDQVRHRQRLLDPAILYVNSDDEELPNLQKCMDRSGLYSESSEVAHTAVEDCIDTLKLTLYKISAHSES